MGWVACLHLTSSLREPRVVRVLAAAALPVLACTVFFTFSRGAILVVPIGVVAYLLLARPRGALAGLLAGVPATAIAVAVCWGADALAADDPTTAAAVDQGRTAAIVIVACMRPRRRAAPRARRAGPLGRRARDPPALTRAHASRSRASSSP